MKLFNQYVTEIMNRFEYERDLKRRVDNLRNIALGERIPFSFNDNKTGEVIVPENTKLTISIINNLVKRWMGGEKFYLDSTTKSEKECWTTMNNILNAIEPDYVWT